MSHFEEVDNKTALQAKSDAQKIAFAPFIFQTAISLRNLGILEALHKSSEGLSIPELSEKLSVSEYGLTVLLEAGLSGEMVKQDGDRYQLTKTGYFIFKDELTRVNMNFVADVCYEGMSHLQTSVSEHKPAGLQVFGGTDTIYPMLSKLPPAAKKSWFEFDHYYSDIAFPAALSLLFAEKRTHVVDVGGNTGKWAMLVAQYNPNVHVTIVDLPSQLSLAKENIEQAGLSDRISLRAADVLKDEHFIPEDADVVWMSQFLDCFSEQEITDILTKAKQDLSPEAHLFIMEPFWDHQRFEAAAFSLINTSLYFTVMANGNSRMYRAQRMQECVENAGLYVAKEHRDVGVVHTLWDCQIR